MAALGDLPDFRLQAGRTDPGVAEDNGVDALVQGEVDGRPVVVAIQVKMGGYPSDLGGAIAHLKAYAREVEATGSRTVVPLLAVPALSKGSRDLLRREGIGYWDRGGSLFL